MKESKINQARTLDEANRILRALEKVPESADQTGVNLCGIYTPGSRKSILNELFRSLSATSAPVDQRALTDFLKTQLDGVNKQSVDSFLTAMIKVASANGTESGPRCVSDLILWMIEQDKEPPRLPAIETLPKGLAIAFEVLAKQDSVPKIALRKWCELARPSMNCLEPDGLKFSESESTRILEAASKLEASIIPKIFYASVPSLVLLAKDGSVSFLTSLNGKPFMKYYSEMRSSQKNETPTTNGPLKSATVPSPKERLKNLLGDVKVFFEDLLSDIELRENELVDKEVSLGNQIKRLEQKIGVEKNERNKLKSDHEIELKTKASEFEELTIKKVTADKTVVALTADLKLSDENATKGMVEQKKRFRNQIGIAVDGPVYSLFQDIQSAMNKNPDSKEIENIAISFDALHRKLIREAELAHKNRLVFKD